MDARLGDTDALIASAVPPLLWSGYELAKAKRLDAVSSLVVAGILLTLLATALGGSPRLIQVREVLVTGAVGVLFLASLVLKRPIIFYLARAASARRTPEGETEFEALWEKPGVAEGFRMMTAVWGVGLICQTGVMVWLAYIWPISRYLLLSPFIGYGILALLLGWSLWYGAKRKALRALAAAHARSKPQDR